MTRRERLLRIFQGRLPDRPAVKLWGAAPSQKLLHPAYGPVHRLAMERTDLVLSAASPFHLHCGREADRIIETLEAATDRAEWVDVISRVNTPEGTLRSIRRRSTEGKPGYEVEHLLKQPEDIRKLLSVPYRPLPFSAESFWSAEKAVGDRGLTIYTLGHAMYGLQTLIGSENFALWSVDCRDLLLEAVQVFSERIVQEATRALDARIAGVFGWVGPELCIPPLMSPADFEEFVFQFDRPLMELIHQRGGHVWVHCHGDMTPVLTRFVEMGVDVLNPIEPPPIGRLTLKQAFDRVDGRMGLEGNIETHELTTATPDRVRRLVREALEAGRGQRFILCPCSGYMEWPQPDRRHIENLVTYIEEGYRCAEEQAG